MEKQEFFAMFGIYFGQYQHAFDTALQLANHNWEFYENSKFSDEALDCIKSFLGIVRKHTTIQGQIQPKR